MQLYQLLRKLEKNVIVELFDMQDQPIQKRCLKDSVAVDFYEYDIFSINVKSNFDAILDKMIPSIKITLTI